MAATTSIIRFLPRARAQPKAIAKLTFTRYKSHRRAPDMTMPYVKPYSARTAGRDMQEIPVDIGLLQNTFVMPTGKNLPSIFTSPRDRLRLEKERIKQRFFDFRDMVIFRFSSKMKLNIWEPKKVALELHKEMYTAFADGDIESLRYLCGESLVESFAKRIIARGRSGGKMQWRFIKMINSPKIVSQKAHHYVGMDHDRRQAVVRIHSLQSLIKFDRNGKVIPGTDEPKEVMEYVVVEKRATGGRETSWYVWGTTEETTIQRLDEEQERERAALGM